MARRSKDKIVLLSEANTEILCRWRNHFQMLGEASRGGCKNTWSVLVFQYILCLIT